MLARSYLSADYAGLATYAASDKSRRRIAAFGDNCRSAHNSSTSLELGLERFHRPAQLLVTVRFDPFGHPLYSGPPFLGGRASLHPRFALPIRFPVKLESQKIKPPVMRPPIVPEAQRLGLVRRHFQ